MTPGEILETEQLPLTARVYAKVPLQPVGLGIAIGATLLAVFLLSEWALGRFALMLSESGEYSPIQEFRIALVHCLLTAFAPTAYVVLIRRMRRTWIRLQGLLGLSAEELRVAVHRVGHRPLWQTASLVIGGVLLYVLATYWTTPGDPFGLQVIVTEVVWHRVLGPIMILYTVLVAVLVVSGSWSLSAAARRIDGLDLLDPSQLEPFKSQALLNALLLLGMAACATPLGVEAHLVPLTMAIWIFTAVFASLGLLLPLVGVHRAIRAARTREFDWCDAALRGARDSLRTAGPHGDGRFAELYAYRQCLEDVSEWPLDAPSFVRFSLYLLIPLGSWLGGAMVERVLDRFVQ